MTKNTTAQNVDPDRVEMASGYRMNTRPAPVRNIKALVMLGLLTGDAGGREAFGNQVSSAKPKTLGQSCVSHAN
jgi:hypothetical protein